MTAVELHRIDETQNMRRFYRLDMQPDLFGGVLLVRQWGRIGAEGRSVAEHFDERHTCRRRTRATCGAQGTAGLCLIFAWYECRAFP